jgi:hypothetical protein
MEQGFQLQQPVAVASSDDDGVRLPLGVLGEQVGFQPFTMVAGLYFLMVTSVAAVAEEL